MNKSRFYGYFCSVLLGCLFTTMHGVVEIFAVGKVWGFSEGNSEVLPGRKIIHVMLVKFQNNFIWNFTFHVANMQNKIWYNNTVQFCSHLFS